MHAEDFTVSIGNEFRKENKLWKVALRIVVVVQTSVIVLVGVLIVAYL